jgi:uncharacterized NAD(P)/FAD-binding protein YdhS
MRPTWETDILRSFADHPNGCATDEEIYEAIRKYRRLTSSHLRFAHGHKHAYHNDVRSHISNLVQKGDLEVLGKGLHRITPQGRRRISM